MGVAGMSWKDVIFKTSCDLMESCENCAELRLKSAAFTRKRRLGPKNLLRMLLN